MAEWNEKIVMESDPFAGKEKKQHSFRFCEVQGPGISEK